MKYQLNSSTMFLYDKNFAKTCFEELLQMTNDQSIEMSDRYEIMQHVYMSVLNDMTSECKTSFSSPFAKFEFVSQQCGFMSEHRRAYLAVNDFRGRCRELYSFSVAETLGDWYLSDLKALVAFISCAYNSKIPSKIAEKLPAEYAERRRNEIVTDCLRVSVIDVDGDVVNAMPDYDGAEPIEILCGENRFGNWAYVLEMIREGSQLNLIRPQIKDGRYCPELIIYEPDYLIDITAITRCITPHGMTPLAHLIHKIEPTSSTNAILLGNFASQMLDEEIHNYGGEPVEYSSSVNSFFGLNALQIATCSEMRGPQARDFHENAKSQQQNIRNIIRNQFEENRSVDLSKIVLEPSFFSEMLGIQGRMDLLQLDFKVLIEQKSGKREFLTEKAKQEHLAQMLLYLAYLHYNRGIRNDDVSSFLLYSKYQDGLMRSTSAPKPLFDALKLRNEIARLDLSLSEGGASVLEEMTPEILNTANIRGKLWSDYIEPRFNLILNTIHGASPLAKRYFYRMFRFVSKEHLLSKIGTPNKEGSGFASTWNSTLNEKLQAGNILYGLSITSLDEQESKQGIVSVTLAIAQMDKMFLPNFRLGDIVILYDYKEGAEPDARKVIVQRSTIVAMSSDSIRVRLRAPQRNRLVFERPEGTLWAIEHDFMESSYSAIYRSLYSFLEANDDRRDLILGTRKPAIDESQICIGEYGSSEFNDLVRRAKCARDYFLIIGPPGTGKTSYGMVNLLREELMSGVSSVLIVAYTNRAVDEICSKLVGFSDDFDFIRIGSRVSCPDEYKDHLLTYRTRDCQKVSEVQGIISSARVFVATTTSIIANIDIFSIKKFSLCIVDEASQILEPQIMSLLTVRQNNENAIGRFVLIGDHKQLPAVVQQSAEESSVDDDQLKDIGLKNCRNSLFERLLSLNTINGEYDPNVVASLRFHGRMHPAIADFPNVAFYNGILQPVPLPHQQIELESEDESDKYQAAVSSRRMTFFDVKLEKRAWTTDKVNYAEAQVIARLVVAAYNDRKSKGREFSPDLTIGVIVPYRNQIVAVRNALESFEIPELLNITIDTVERYQGSQRDIIIYGTTIKKKYQLDFLTGNSFVEGESVIDRKLNVAITRAREHLILVGNEHLLASDDNYRRLIASMRSV